MNKIYYSKEKQCLVYVNKVADSHFWDSLWETNSIKKEIQSGKHDLFVGYITQKFLKPKKSTRVLEGGCGKGNYVYSLLCRGYDAYGIDYAEQTVKKINAAMPQLQITLGDVRSISYPDNYFDGYWSLGVIEHFWDGFGQIASEMQRVLKNDGYLFLTFPYLSPLRKKNIRNGLYPILEDKTEPKDFYQFALDPEQVLNHFKKLGFSLVWKKPFDGLKGILDETSHPILHKWIYNIYNTKNPIVRIFKLGLTVLLAPYSGHVILLVLKKNR
jgi:SAM-dependent methyltransferase